VLLLFGPRKLGVPIDLRGDLYNSELCCEHANEPLRCVWFAYINNRSTVN